MTARNRDVNAEKIGGKVYENVYQLNGLSVENGLDLFQKKLVEKEELSGNFLEISKGIVDQCKKLPLSIVIIAGILRDTERTEKKWNQIAEIVSSRVLSDPQGNCKAIIELSYNQLPNYLRSCFLYLGIFPEDQEILVNRLILLWVAEGFVQDTKTARAENVAKKYMKDLISKSLVIPIKGTSRGGVKTFRLHDLMRDFCLDKAKEKHFFTLLDKRNLPLKDPRRLIIYGGSKGLKLSYHSIRSMISFDEVEYFDIEKVIESYDMVIIKVLEVSKKLYPSFPDVSSLVHLTYLGLRLWDKSIPSPISKLENLQILILLCGDDVMKVPDSIWDMVKLRHVSIRTGASFEIDSTRVENPSSLLENLRYLSKAHVSCNDSEWLSKLSGVERLSCFYTSDDDSECNQSEKLRFNDYLTSLKVENASRQRFATTCQLPNNLEKLTLSKVFLKSNDISEIGRTVPRLEVLKIYNCHVFSKFEWNVVDEDFPKLKVLKLRDLNISKWIASKDSFPNVEQLWVEDCHYLEEIPIAFGMPLCLQLITVRECASSVDTSATRIKELQHKQNNKKMKVRIYPKYGFY